METPHSLQTVKELVKDIEVAMLTTVDVAGNLRSRPMMAQAMQEDGDLWFLTRMTSPLVEETRGQPHVNVSFANPEEFCFVSISGTADALQDRDQIHAFWKPGYERYIPEGPDAPDLALLRVHTNQAEYWDREKNKMVLIKDITA